MKLENLELKIGVVGKNEEGFHTTPVYYDFEQFKKENPNSGYKFVYVTIDTTTGKKPDYCYGVYDNPTDAFEDMMFAVKAMKSLKSEKQETAGDNQ